MPVFQHSKLEVCSRILFFLALQSLGVGIAILRVLHFLDVMYSHWEQCREVIEESVVLNFFLKCVEKVVVFYIFLDISCEEFAM